MQIREYTIRIQQQPCVRGVADESVARSAVSPPASLSVNMLMAIVYACIAKSGLVIPCSDIPKTSPMLGIDLMLGKPSAHSIVDTATCQLPAYLVLRKLPLKVHLHRSRLQLDSHRQRATLAAELCAGVQAGSHCQVCKGM